MIDKYYLTDDDIHILINSIKELSNTSLQLKLERLVIKYLKKNKVLAIKENGEIIR
jgi:hypothetical protein